MFVTANAPTDRKQQRHKAAETLQSSVEMATDFEHWSTPTVAANAGDKKSCKRSVSTLRKPPFAKSMCKSDIPLCVFAWMSSSENLFSNACGKNAKPLKIFMPIDRDITTAESFKLLANCLLDSCTSARERARPCGPSGSPSSKPAACCDPSPSSGLSPAFSSFASPEPSSSGNSSAKPSDACSRKGHSSNDLHQRLFQPM